MKMGIDFGTSFCTMSWMNPETRKPEIIRDADGLEKIPSVVYWSATGRHLVGRAAEDQFLDAAGMSSAEREDVVLRTVRNIKNELLPGRTIPLPDGKAVAPEEVVAELLRYLKRNAEDLCFHQKISNVVLTHPVTFSQRQKDLLIAAAESVGFKTVELMPEPIAAVRGYASSGSKVGEDVLVVDLGGGTLDLAYLRRNDSGEYVPVLSPQGNAQCGGTAFDRAIYGQLEAECKNQNGWGFSDDSETNALVLHEARVLKERLSRSDEARFSYFDEATHTPYQTRVDQAQCKNMCASVLAQLSFSLQNYLEKMEENQGKIDSAILIGGATRMPLVVGEVEKHLKKYGVRPEKTMQVDVAVALGAIANEEKGKSVCKQDTVHVTTLPQERKPKPGDVKVVKLPGGAKVELVYCPPGEFEMGSPTSEKGRNAENEVLHHVKLTKGFWIGKYPLTVGVWRSVVFRYTSFGWLMPHLFFNPVINVSWNDAQKFLREAGQGLRLPTEAEWEYACRAGTVGPYSGTGFLEDMGWYAENSGGRDHGRYPVGLKRPNAWGLYDMHGNVFEWCQDVYTCKLVEAEDPRIGVNGSEMFERRVIRGGCCNLLASACRSAARESANAGCNKYTIIHERSFLGIKYDNWSEYDVGFRLCCDA